MLWAAPLCFSHSFLSRAGLHILNLSHWQHKQWAPQDAISDHYATSQGSWWPIGSSITVLADLAHTLCCSHQGFHKRPGGCASHKTTMVNYYVWMAILLTKARAYICSYHLCWCALMSLSFIFCAYNLLDLKRLKVLTLLIGSMVVLDV